MDVPRASRPPGSSGSPSRRAVLVSARSHSSDVGGVGAVVDHVRVRGEYDKTGLQFVSGGDNQEVAEKLYANLMTNMRAAIPDMRGRSSPQTGRSPWSTDTSPKV